LSLAGLFFFLGVLSCLLGQAQEHRPGVLYSTYLGGSGNERGDAIAVDKEGNVYVAGVTTSTDFPTTEGAFRRTVIAGLQCNNFSSWCPNAVFVAKISPDGQRLIWSTYLHQGWSFGSHGLGVNDLQVNAAGEVYIAGTSDEGFPVTPGSPEPNCPAYDIRITPVCAFVAKLSPDGSRLLFSSYFGGNILGMTIRKLRLDNAGNVVLAGNTFADIAFLSKLDPQFTKLLFIRRLGGTGGEIVNALEVDEGGIYVGGNTRSNDFPATPGALKSHLTGEADGFITKLSHGGDVIFSTLVGGSKFDSISALWIEPGGECLVSGRTLSTDFPTSLSAYQPAFAGGLGDAFASSISADGSVLLFSTLLGGSGDSGELTTENAWGIARTSNGSVQVVGYTRAPDFPVQNSSRLKPEGQCFRRACEGIFIASFDATATRLLSSTVVGGPTDDKLRGGAYQSKRWWLTGTTSEFPATPDALQPTEVGTGRAFIAQLYAGPQDFSLEVPASPLVLSGGKATTTLLLAAAPAFADEVTLSCQDVPASYSCQFSPAKVFLGAGKKQVVLTIERNPGLASVLLLLSPLGLALGLSPRPFAKRRFLFLLVMFAVSLLAGCRGILPPESQTRTITIKIMAQSQTVSHFTSLQLSADPR
jgi:hypothetical protein